MSTEGVARPRSLRRPGQDQPSVTGALPPPYTPPPPEPEPELPLPAPGGQHSNRCQRDQRHQRATQQSRPIGGGLLVACPTRSARVIIAGHALIQNLRRGHSELAVEAPVNRRGAVAFDELALMV